jgi:hypothetical protein
MVNKISNCKSYYYKRNTGFVQCFSTSLTHSGAFRRGGRWFNPPSPKFRSFAKAEPNSQFRGIYIRNNLIRIWVSLICKLSGTPDYGATAPRSPFSLPSVLNWIYWTPRKKFLGKPLLTHITLRLSRELCVIMKFAMNSVWTERTSHSLAVHWQCELAS